MILRYVAKIRNEMLWRERNDFQLPNHCALFSPKWLGWQILSQNMGRDLATWPIINSVHQTFHDPESNIIECTIYHGTFKFPLMWNCFAQDMNIHVILKLIRLSSNIRFHLCMIFIACKPFLCEGSIYIGGVRNFTPETAKSHRKIWKDRWDCWGQVKSWWDVNFNNGIYGPPCPTLLSHKTKPFLQMKFLEIENECKAKVWQRFANFKVIFLLSIMFGPQW